MIPNVYNIWFPSPRIVEHSNPPARIRFWFRDSSLTHALHYTDNIIGRGLRCSIFQLRRDACESLPHTHFSIVLSSQDIQWFESNYEWIDYDTYFLGKNMYIGITLPYIYSRTSPLFRARAKYMHVFYQSRGKEAHKNWNVCDFISYVGRYSRVIFHYSWDMTGITSWICADSNRSLEQYWVIHQSDVVHKYKKKIVKYATSSILSFNNEFHGFRSIFVSLYSIF